jgi:hypothetical protein
MKGEIMEDAPAIPLEKLVKTYIKINQVRAEIKARFEEEDKALKAKTDAIKAALLQHCKDHEVESVRTNEGTFFRTVKTQYWTSDWSSLHNFVLENRIPDILEKRINQGNMKAWIEQNPDSLPAGLNITQEYSVTIRRKQ